MRHSRPVLEACLSNLARVAACIHQQLCCSPGILTKHCLVLRYVNDDTKLLNTTFSYNLYLGTWFSFASEDI